MKQIFQKLVAGLAVLLLLAMQIPAFAQTAPNFYQDVPQNYWGYQYINRLLSKGVLMMPQNAMFYPENRINRAEFVKMVVLSLYPDFSAANLQPGFSDVDINAWYGPVVAYSKANNILSGYPDGTFRPGNNITRAEAMSVITRALKVQLNQNPVLAYVDVTASWQKPPIQAVTVLQIANGYDATHFGPNDFLTRAQAAKIIDRAMEVKATKNPSAGGEIVMPDSAYEQNPNPQNQDSQTPTPTPTTTPTTGTPLPTSSVDPATQTYIPPSTVPNITNAPNTVATHPRLWLTQADVATYRTWAVDSNPMYSQGLKVLAERLKSDMDAGRVPGEDNGGVTYTEYPTEAYAQVFAFMSLIENDPAVRDDYANRAHTLLMHVINEAAKGVVNDVPFRDESFAVYDRSRWYGSGFPTTVDWIYPSLTADDKAKIRTVFLRWINESVNAYNQNPVRMRTESGYATQIRFRRSMNNYQLSQMRQIGLMALALDPADDPQNELRNKLSVAEDYMWAADTALKTDGRGGLSAEGFQYGPNSLGRYAQFALALATSGSDATATCSCRVLDNNPFWAAVVPAYLHSLSSTMTGTTSYNGGFYQPAWYGDGQHYYADDTISLFGPLALYYQKKNLHANQVDAVRYIQKNMQVGGVQNLYDRASDGNFPLDGIFYFMLFSPESINQQQQDPRPGFGLNYLAEGIGRMLSRTGWNADARWFTYKLGWNNMDHQHGDGNMFEFYRNGEWLTKERTGYGVKIGSSDYKNTLAIQNNPSNRGAEDFNTWNNERGSQYYLSANGDGKMLSYSFGSDYTYVLGDATQLYNSSRIGATDVTHASRSIVWLKPDYVFIYDRATTATSGRYKRFWLNTPSLASVNGHQATATTSKGQKLVVTSLLPANAAMTAAASETEAQMNGESEIADGYNMHFRLKVEAPGNPADTRFLHVLQGLDANASVQTPVLVQSASGTSFAGAVLGDAAVMFPVAVSTSFSGTTYVVPSNVTKQYVTGLTANASYGVTITAVANGLQVAISPNGSTQIADQGGVLKIQHNGTTVTTFQNNAVGGQNMSGVSANVPVQNQSSPSNVESSSSSGANVDTGASSSDSNTSSSDGSSSASSPSANSSADVSVLTIAGGTLTPAFSTATSTYTLTVPAGASTVQLTATLDDPTALLYINGNPATSGQAKTVGFWNNVITVTVYNANWQKVKEYTIQVQS